jgi:esterase/lipase superfamily enzyme
MYDFDSARLAVGHLTNFLQLVASRSGAKHIHLIAHSMGNWPLLEALDKFTAEPGGAALNQIILAAPDIDVEEFELIAQRIASKAQGVTLYASSNDRAIVASRTLRRNVARAGDVLASGPVVVVGIDTIDVSTLSMDVLSLNHSTYADRKELLNDIHHLMRTGVRPPNDRSDRLQRQMKEGQPFWRYVTERVP